MADAVERQPTYVGGGHEPATHRDGTATQGLRTLPRMILRIVLGRFATAPDTHDLIEMRTRLARTARTVDGLESLIIGGRRTGEGASGEVDPGRPPVEAVIVTIWRDVDSMTRATAIDEEKMFLRARLDLPFIVEATDHYEIVGRTFAALPSERPAPLLVLRVRAGPHDEASLVQVLRNQQQRLVGLGLVASHLGRRMVDQGVVDVVHVLVWADRETVDAAANGEPGMPVFAAELAPWRDGLSLDRFDGIEIVPHLPLASGAPLLIVDSRFRIVDMTTAAAATLGLSADNLIGATVDRLATMVGEVPSDGSTEAAWGVVAGGMAWAVPGIGEILVRFVARRDTPVDGRHAVIVRRFQDPPPTADDLDRAVAEAFPIG